MVLVMRWCVMGVEIGALAAAAVSTFSLFVVAHRQVRLSTRELLTLFVSWLVWTGVCVAVSSQNTAPIVCAGLAILGMAWTQFTTFWDSHEFSINEATV